VDYFLQTADGKQAGPYSLAQIRAFWTDGKVTMDTPYWTEGMKKWLPLRGLESKLSPPVPMQHVTKAPRKGLGCGSGCLILVVLFGAFVGFLCLLPDDNQTKPHPQIPAVWPPRTITISDKVDDDGSHENFVLCGQDFIAGYKRDIQAICNEYIPAAPPDDVRVSDPAVEERFEKALKDGGDRGMEAGLKLEAAYLQDGKAVLIPAGTYNITGFFSEYDGQPLADDGWKEGAAYVSINYNGKTLFSYMDLVRQQIDYYAATNNAPTSDRNPHPQVLTKDEWKSHAPGLVNGNQIACNRERLFAAVGEPDRTQTVGDDSYLYWQCSDGEIQVVCSQFAYGMGIVSGTVNDY
jgi:hypothetical protein